MSLITNMSDVTTDREKLAIIEFLLRQWHDSKNAMSSGNYSVEIGRLVESIRRVIDEE